MQVNIAARCVGKSDFNRRWVAEARARGLKVFDAAVDMPPRQIADSWANEWVSVFDRPLLLREDDR
jgi:hypothetical protein